MLRSVSEPLVSFVFSRLSSAAGHAPVPAAITFTYNRKSSIVNRKLLHSLIMHAARYGM